MWTNRVLMCGIDILLCLWAVYLFFFYFDIFFARKRKRYLSMIGITLFVIWLQFTMPSGLHSVLERPFSEANGRPFLVKRSPLIVC